MYSFASFTVNSNRPSISLVVPAICVESGKFKSKQLTPAIGFCSTSKILPLIMACAFAIWAQPSNIIENKKIYPSCLIYDYF